MVKNKQGGNRHKKMARKNVKNAPGSPFAAALKGRSAAPVLAP